MEAVLHPAPAGGRRVLCLMLPGLQMKPEDFYTEGLIEEAQQEGAAVDVAIPAVTADDYFDQGFSAALEARILAPARARGCRQIVCLGISLGGFGAIVHLMRNPAAFDRLLLLAPFLGNPGTLAEVARAGGLGTWAPGTLAPGDIERPALLWVKSHIESQGPPLVHLGYGRQDRFVQASALLEALLPAESVVTAEGGHDWATWRALWRLLLARFPLTARS